MVACFGKTIIRYYLECEEDFSQLRKIACEQLHSNNGCIGSILFLWYKIFVLVHIPETFRKHINNSESKQTVPTQL